MTDDWLTLSIPSPPPAQHHLLVDALRRAGARAVERDGDRVVALFPAADAAALLADVRTAVRASTELSDPEITWERRSHAEWAARWRAEQPALRVTDRIVVAPAGADLTAGEAGGRVKAGPTRGQAPDVRVAEGDAIVWLDPGVAFGTAEHPTTRVCLALMDGRVRPGDRVLDVGAGSGILAIAAARLGATRVLALESDPVACDTARRNVALNAVGDRVELREREVGPSDLKRVGRYDGVVINIQAAVSVPLVGAVPAALAPDGWLILSGLVGDERDEAVAAAGRAGLTLAEERPDRSWWTGVFERG